jgi:hypothetical protein
MEPFALHRIEVGGGTLALAPLPADAAALAMVLDWRPDLVLSLTVRAFGPAGKDPLQRDDGVIEHDPQEREGDQHREHQRVIPVRLARFEQRAKAAPVGRDDLDQIGADEGQRDRDFQRAEELGQGLGQRRSCGRS